MEPITPWLDLILSRTNRAADYSTRQYDEVIPEGSVQTG